MRVILRLLFQLLFLRRFLLSLSSDTRLSPFLLLSQLHRVPLLLKGELLCSHHRLFWFDVRLINSSDDPRRLLFERQFKFGGLSTVQNLVALVALRLNRHWNRREKIRLSLLILSEDFLLLSSLFFLQGKILVLQKPFHYLGILVFESELLLPRIRRLRPLHWLIPLLSRTL